ncbi:MAG: Hsp20/alpha crystallin family protein [Solirubrobacteraceae bacterium MAG38_C4-C5]|nr:Hsp20/alpha crystallin family protein [Candidatus Siliceabacter maunaloa]
MALIRWEPAREIASLQGDMNRLFNTFVEAPGNESTRGRHWVPAMDLVEESEHYVLRADLPGLDEGDVKVEVEGDTLTLSGERKVEHREEKEGYLRLERSTGAFRRTLHLPAGVQPDGIQASFDRGVLEVRIPKPAQRTPRRIEIGVCERPAAIEGEAA